MDWGTLAKTVTSAYSEGALKLSASLFDGSIANFFEQNLKISELVVTDIGDEPKPDDKTQTIDCKGVCKLADGESKFTCILHFFMSSGDAQLAIANTLTDGWCFSKRYKPLEIGIFDQLATTGSSTLYFSSAEANLQSRDIPKGIYFFGQFDPHRAKSQVLQDLQLFADSSSLPAFGSIQCANKIPDISLTLDIKNASLARYFKNKTLPLTFAIVNETYEDINKDERGRDYLEVKAAADFGGSTKFSLSTALYSFPQPGFDFSSTGFSGIPLPDKGEIGRWIGNTDLTKWLPSVYNDSGITLDRIDVGLSNNGVDYASFLLSAKPSSPWTIVHGRLSIESLTGAIRVDQPFSGPTLSASLSSRLDIGSTDGIAFDLVYSKAGDINALSGTLPAGQSVKLETIARVFYPNVGDLHLPTLDALNFSYTIGDDQSWSFYTALSDISIPLPKSELKVQDLDIALSNAKSEIKGDIEIEGQTASLVWSVGEGFDAKAEFGTFKVDIAKLVGTFSDGSWTAPSWFTVSFNKTVFELQEDAGGKSLQLSFMTQTKFGKSSLDLIVAIRRFDAATGFVVGGLLATNLKLNVILPQLPGVLGKITIQKAALAVADKAGDFDIATLFPDSGLTSKDYGLGSGFLLFNVFGLDGDVDFAWILKPFLPKSARESNGTILSCLALDGDQGAAKLLVNINENVWLISEVVCLQQLKVSVGGSSAGFEISIAQTGIIHYKEKNGAQRNQDLNFEGSVSGGTDGINGEVKVDGLIPNVFGTSLNLKRIILEVTAKVGQVTFGFGGKVNFDTKVSPEAKDIGLFFQFAGPEVVTISGCYGQPSTLFDLHNNFCETKLTTQQELILTSFNVDYFSLIATAVSIKASDIEFVCGKDDMPKTNTYSPGFYFRAAMDFGGWHLKVLNLAVSKDGMKGSVEMDPISIGSRKTVAFIMTDKPGSSKGPHFNIDTTKLHFDISGYVNFVVLNGTMVSLSTQAVIDKDRVKFHLSYKILWGLSQTFDLDLSHNSFKVDTSIKLGRKVWGHWVGVGGRIVIGADPSGVSACVYVTCITSHHWVLLSIPSRECSKYKSDAVYADETGDYQEIEKQADQAIDNWFVDLKDNPQAYIDMYNKTTSDGKGEKEDQPIFEALDISVIAEIYHKYVQNQSSLQAAEAIDTLEGKPEDPADMALALWRCKHPDEHLHDHIYDPADVIPAVKTLYERDGKYKLDCTYAASILRQKLEVSKKPFPQPDKEGGTEAAAILYQMCDGQHLYSDKSEIKSALMSKDAYNLSDTDAQSIIDGLT